MFVVSGCCSAARRKRCGARRARDRDCSDAFFFRRCPGRATPKFLSRRASRNGFAPRLLPRSPSPTFPPLFTQTRLKETRSFLNSKKKDQEWRGTFRMLQAIFFLFFSIFCWGARESQAVAADLNCRRPSAKEKPAAFFSSRTGLFLSRALSEEKGLSRV